MATVLVPVKSTAPARPRDRQRLRPLTLVFAVLVMLASLVPFYWLINTSLKTGAELSSGSLFPTAPSLQNYLEVLQDGKFLTALGNSVIVGVVTTSLALLLASFAAYALARLALPRKGLILAAVLSVTTFPVIAIAAPMFKIWSDLGIYDTLPGLIIPKLTFALPMAIFVLTSFFREIPFELEESALIDGATPFQAFRKVILPLAVPGIATTAILVFISVWNEFLLAVTLTSTPTSRTVPVAIAFFAGTNEFEQPIGTISAASVIVTLPLLLLVLLFQKRIVAGLTAGAIKG
ncbi:carbohydrate ABC transporter membrane protein 2, CUT1 family (TC 3.A.1.1.-) [Saccharopolyspora kobensis]|uniref:Carbohydrate ABC transporter membrane protein 2, CUT1 family n=1 Tax=Saccharopolyspora kobensis TaxID=146035 RepID=A0A1H5URE6_9PSEU|nr:carbohydrate ABC transporter permease [Saccharopolyspora kobensis]SEF77609.1 carbohydrate ABC transporter membrane protein 2, CUT1 family (TC 3.A.1.1.-) [Saccharopolyspora kobensis]SFC70400.1 carbohydrate ABC transporter membrane protein 2, CUT1 family [Saccharopolyspora kobensis]